MTTRITLFGTGCARCKATARMIEEMMAREGLDAELVKVEDMAEIMAQGILSTPGIAVNGTMRAVGRVPRREEIRRWSDEAAAMG